MASVAHAATFVTAHPEYPVLPGVDPSGPEIEYGWIETGEVVGHVQGEAAYHVRRFWEKPTCTQANSSGGAYWTSRRSYSWVMIS